MALWKDSSNQVHDDMDGEALSLPIWPQGMVQITQAEADALLAATDAELLAQAQASVNPIDVLRDTLIAQGVLTQDAIDATTTAAVNSALGKLKLP